MLRNRLYYSIKPWLPYSLRLSVRGWLARRKRDQVRHIWPILPGSQRPPDGWPGWPDGKKFALVLTHDVEGRAGLDKCRKLMQLEKNLGFRSSFNFVPEGEYRVTAELRQELVSNGFEVGVHDLYHNGRLYCTRSRFAQSAARINGYLKEWGAVGFRSGFMLHNFDWLHDLQVEYDLSTFDTDPFEPQPDSAGTIFPFWVAAPLTTDPRPPTPDPRRTGYIELPYTLPQDSTLFLLLNENGPDIWLRKLDWVARHSGMVLLNAHPDYMRMPGSQNGKAEYPVRFYEEVLRHISTRYAGTYWAALPRDVAAYYRQVMHPRPSTATAAPPKTTIAEKL